ncbi:MAG: NADH-quinone oxidoreductase subunit C [Planctomycetes bacterium]|nr:NADH-quinone oxidoreductase subunit C [Planctomycetota bacterium]
MSEPAATPSAPAPAAPADPVTALAARKLRAALGAAVLEVVETGRHPYVRVAPGAIVAAATLVRDDPELAMDCCHLVTGVDWPAKTPADGPGELEVVYHLVSYARRPAAEVLRSKVKSDNFLALKVRVPRDKPEVPSVMGVWVGADWHERETWDLLGVRFTGRPPLRRILLPEDWPGHPLRKDWEYPVEYHGIPIIPPEGR